MLKFNHFPATADSVEVDPSTVRFLTYGIEDRCINSTAEVCASIVMGTAHNLHDILAIGEKIADEIAGSPASKCPEDDAGCFMRRYAATVAVLNKRVAELVTV